MAQRVARIEARVPARGSRLVMGRLSLIVTVALVAAALGDVLVERLANTGLFGQGYADDDQSGVVPALLCAAIVAAVGVAGATRELVRSAARQLWHRSLLRDLPAIGALQIAGVLGIERTEAALHGAALAPGLGWLGAPVFASLAVHAIVCLICIFALSAVLRALVRTCAAIVRRVLTALYELPAAPGPLVSRRSRPRTQAAAVAAGRRRGMRAPPSSFAFA